MDVIQRVLDDHIAIKAAYERVQTLQGAEADKWLNELIWLVAKHAAAEELILYPLLDKLGPAGHALAKQSRHDHHATKEALQALDGRKVTPETRQQIDRMMADLLEHMAMEEGAEGDLEVIRRGLTTEELLKAGKEFKRTRRLVPTHPHPAAPDKPPFENVVGLLALPIDKLRDLFRSFPEEADEHH